MKSPTAIAFAFMAIVAALYEPLRLSLSHRVAQNIGGVGGVGGLANMLGAGDDRCDPTSNHINNSSYHDNYCYEKGAVGPFTPFAFLMMVLWNLPLTIAALVSIIYCKGPHRESNDTNEKTLGLLATVWVGLNIQWFLIPLSVFWFGLQADPDLSHNNFATLQILAVSIAASHPLSWNLMVASIPASGVSTMLLGCSRKTMSECHRFVSYSTMWWGSIHGIGEIIYLAMAKSRSNGKRLIWVKIFLQEDGEDILFLLGLVALILLFAQGMVGYFRNFIRSHDWSFRSIHRGLAITFLLTAAGHWWPFYIFLIPAAALHGTGIACLRMGLNGDESDEKSLSSLPKRLSRAEVGIMVSLSIAVSLLSTYVVFVVRENYMRSSSATLAGPFIFPVLSVFVSLISSTSVSMVYIVTCKGEDGSRNLSGDGLEVPLTEESPLLEIEANDDGEESAY